jgi:uncharacterized lipoprotein YehR (DUF1307 family)
MKKFIFIAVLSVFLTGCGVGTYSVQSGVEDAAYVTFTAAEKQEITVNVDGKTYNVNTVKQKAYKKDRDIKHTSMNTIKLAPGQHNVSVSLDGNEVYNHKVFLSTGETRIVEL